MLKILFLPRWYPNKTDPQLGIFVKKHAAAAAKFNKVAVVYAYPVKNQLGRMTEVLHEKEVFTIITYYRQRENKLLNLFNYYRSLMAGWRIVNKEFGLPDLLHVHMMARPAVFAFFIKLLKGTPYLISDHWSGYTEFTGVFDKKPAVYKAVVRFLASRAAVILPVSEFLKNEMIRCGIKGPYEVIPNVVEECVGSTEGGTQKILNVSDLVDKIKNISGIIRVMPDVVKKFSNVQLDIIGGGPDQKILEDLVRQYPELNGKVVFHGLQPNEEVYNQLAKASFLVVNSNVETFGVTAAEALSCGKPVVATKCGGPEDFLSEGTGILIEAGNSEQLKIALIRMVEKYNTYDPVQLAAIVNSRYSYDEVGKRITAIYSRVVCD